MLCLCFAPSPPNSFHMPTDQNQVQMLKKSWYQCNDFGLVHNVSYQKMHSFQRRVLLIHFGGPKPQSTHFRVAKESPGGRNYCISYIYIHEFKLRQQLPGRSPEFDLSDVVATSRQVWLEVRVYRCVSMIPMFQYHRVDVVSEVYWASRQHSTVPTSNPS